MLTLVFTLTGCVSVQQASPILAPYVAGRMTCPHCGLLKEQGCPCQPDLWNHGYRPTDWRPMSGMIVDEPAVPRETLPPALNAPSSVELPPVRLDMNDTTMSIPHIDRRNRY